MELKYLAAIFAILFSIVFSTMFAGLGYDSYNRKECRVELAKAGKSAEDIAKVCK